jgi:hypothetical protein
METGDPFNHCAQKFGDNLDPATIAIVMLVRAYTQMS